MIRLYTPNRCYSTICHLRSICYIGIGIGKIRLNHWWHSYSIVLRRVSDVLVVDTNEELFRPIFIHLTSGSRHHIPIYQVVGHNAQT